MIINSFDLDGVVIIGDSIGVRPGPDDVIITGRCVQEAPHTMAFLRANGIDNQVFFNPIDFKDKTRDSSGKWKATVIRDLIQDGLDIRFHFEDDEVQKDVIEKYCGRFMHVIHLVHDLTEKENVWHGE